MGYRCRNDFVLIRVINKGKAHGLAMPDKSAEGKERIVEAIGPKVEDLKVGDKVFVIGTNNQDVIALPGEVSLFLTREANVVLIVEDKL